MVKYKLLIWIKIVNDAPPPPHPKDPDVEIKYFLEKYWI